MASRSGMVAVVPRTGPTAQGPVALQQEICRQIAQAGVLKREADELRETGQLYDCYMRLWSAHQLLEYANGMVASMPGAFQCDAQLCTQMQCHIGDMATALLAEYQALEPSVRKYLDGIPKEGRTDDVSEGEAAVCSMVVQFKAGSAECESWFDLIIGLEDAKRDLELQYVYPLLYPNMVPRSKATLLYGPPGTGKTLCAKAAVNELSRQAQGCFRVVFIAPSLDRLKGKYVGETEKNLTQLWYGASALASSVQAATQQKTVAVIFLDEVDGLAPRGRGGEGAMAQIAASAVNTLLQLMDGIDSPQNVSVLAATNYPWNLDEAFLRRFSSQIFIDLPTAGDITRHLHQLFSRHFTQKGVPEQEIAKKQDKNCRAPNDTCLPMPNRNDYAYREAPYTYYQNSMISEAAISDIAQQCADKHFSGSDVARLFNEAVRIAADQAIRNGRFFQALDTSGQPLMVESKDAEPVKHGVLISTLCLPVTEKELAVDIGGQPYDVLPSGIREPTFRFVVIDGTRYVNYLESNININLGRTPYIADLYINNDAPEAVYVILVLRVKYTAIVDDADGSASTTSTTSTSALSEFNLDKDADALIIERARRGRSPEFDAALKEQRIARSITGYLMAKVAITASKSIDASRGKAPSQGWFGGLGGLFGRGAAPAAPTATEAEKGKPKQRRRFATNKSDLIEVVVDAIRDRKQAAEWYIGSVADWVRTSEINNAELLEYIATTNKGGAAKEKQTTAPVFSAAANPFYAGAKTPTPVQIDFEPNPRAQGSSTGNVCNTETLAKNYQFRVWNVNAQHLHEALDKVKPSFNAKDYNDLREYREGNVDKVLARRRGESTSDVRKGLLAAIGLGGGDGIKPVKRSAKPGPDPIRLEEEEEEEEEVVFFPA